MKNKKVVTAVVSVLLAMTMIVETLAVPSIDSVKKEREQTQGNLNKISEQIEGLESVKEEVNEEITEMNTELVDILTSIGVCQYEIEIKEKEIEEASGKLTIAEMNESSQYESMKRRVQFLYEKGDKAYMQAIIESSGYSDLVNKADYVEKLYEYDHSLLEKYVAVRQEVSHLKELLEQEEDDLEAARFELGQEQAALETMISEKKRTVENFDQQLAEARNTAQAMQKQLEQQTAQIKALEEAKKKQQELELKKQQEAAQKALEEAKKKEKANNANNSAAAAGTTVIDTETGKNEVKTDNSAVSDVNASDTTATDAYTTTNEELSAGVGSVAVDSSGSSEGQNVINYACQFVGNPYVYGGTSLTNGTDCSGFTQAVYKHFGVTLPRDSTSQRSVGTAVSYEEAKPGDIVCYAGHVALYMGNGMIVHASTERTGITYSPATYRTILSIRRVL